MTTALEDAFAKAAALPPERQEAIAAILLEEIAVDDRWQRSFAQSQDALSRLAAEALEEDARGRTLDMVPKFPRYGSQTHHRLGGDLLAEVLAVAKSTDGD